MESWDFRAAAGRCESAAVPPRDGHHYFLGRGSFLPNGHLHKNSYALGSENGTGHLLGGSRVTSILHFALCG